MCFHLLSKHCLGSGKRSRQWRHTLLVASRFGSRDSFTSLCLDSAWPYRVRSLLTPELFYIKHDQGMALQTGKHKVLGWGFIKKNRKSASTYHSEVIVDKSPSTLGSRCRHSGSFQPLFWVDVKNFHWIKLFVVKPSRHHKASPRFIRGTTRVRTGCFHCSQFFPFMLIPVKQRSIIKGFLPAMASWTIVETLVNG